MTASPEDQTQRFSELPNKVAQVTFAFWIMKILATTLGETAGDFVSMTLALGYYVGLAITFGALLVILIVQITGKRYNPPIYWAAIVGTTTAGTEVSDMMDRSLGLGYTTGSIILATGLAATLFLWWYRDRDLSVFPIRRRDEEIFYWVAIIFSNSLGTAFGDFLTDNAGLSYVEGALVTAAVIGVVVVLHYTRALNDIVLFWIAFIFTRPFGATFGDFLTKPLASGGLNLPREYASVVTLLLLATVLFVATRRRKSQVNTG